MEGCLKFLFEDHCYIISDVKKGVGSEIARFADDIKLFMKDSVREDCEKFQMHLKIRSRTWHAILCWQSNAYYRE